MSLDPKIFKIFTAKDFQPDGFHFLRDGTPCGFVEWLQKFEDKEYKIVKQTKLLDGHFISTVWLGLNHGFDGKKLIFETTVFDKFGHTIEQRRWETEEEAILGHQKFLENFGFGKQSNAKQEIKRALVSKDGKTYTEYCFPCPNCGFLVVLKFGKFGPFYSCSQYPECDYSANYTKTNYMMIQNGM